MNVEQARFETEKLIEKLESEMTHWGTQNSTGDKTLTIQYVEKFILPSLKSIHGSLED